MLPNHINSQHLRKHFQEFREHIANVFVVRDQVTMKTKGYGFVTFTSHASASAAIQKLNGSKLQGKYELLVKFKHNQERRLSKESRHSLPVLSSSRGKPSFSTSPRPKGPYYDCTSSDSDTESNPEECTLYIRPKYKVLPDYVTSKHITEHFKEFKKHIVSSRIIRDQATKKSKGFGFITFSSKASAQAAIQTLNGSRLHGKFELVMEYEHGKTRAGKQMLPMATSTSSACASPGMHTPAEHRSERNVLYVRAKYTVLPDYINGQHLKKHFREFKEDIVSARMIRDHVTGKSKGYGFITFTSVQAAEEAIQELNGSKLNGKFNLLVEFDHRNECTPPPPTACNKPSKLHKTATVKTIPLKCTPEQMMYLKLILFQESSQETEQLLQALPVKVTCQQDQILLSGTPVLTEQVQTIILKSSLLHGLLSHSYSFTCHSKFLKQIEEHVLQPMSREKGLEVLYHCQEYGDEAQGQCPSFTISIFSKKPVHFREASKLMQPLTPQSKTFHVEANTKQLMLRITEIGKRNHRCCIQFTDSPTPAVQINGLCLNDIESCWKETEHYIESNLTIVRRIAVDKFQLKYLQRKHSKLIEKVDAMCTLLIPRSAESATVRELSIILSGKMIIVRECAKRMEELVKRCTAEDLPILCPTTDVIVWERKWDSFIQEQQEKYDILVEYRCSQPTANQRLERSGSTLVTFLVYGSDKFAIAMVKQQILSKSEKRIRLSEVELEHLLKGLKDKRIDPESKYSVMINVNRTSKEVTLSTPPLIKGYLLSAEEEVLRFIHSCMSTTSKETNFDDAVIGLLLTTSSLPQLRKLGDENNVLVCPLAKPSLGIQLKGTQAAIENVEQGIQLIVSELSQSITTDQYAVSYSYLPMFATPDFTHFVADLQEELCVACSYPAVAEESSCKVLRQVCLQNPSGNATILQICEGSLVQQKVDAIVNEANEDLLLTDGLAKTILAEGGPLIQVECTTHIQSKGKIQPGTAVCLGSGNLPCKKVIHCVYSKNDSNGKLLMAVFCSLRCAERNGIGSIAFPAISTLATLQLQAVNAHCTEASRLRLHSSIHTIRIVLSTSQSREFLKVFDSNPHFSVSAKTSNSSVTLQPSSTSPATYKWFWEDDAESFSPYPLHISNALTVEYSMNPNGVSTCKIDGKFYQIDFQKMKQTNLSTGYTRNVKREQVEGNPQRNIRWYYKDDTGHFVPYSLAGSDRIEKKYNQGTPTQQGFLLSILGRVYTIDFQSMFQINYETQHKRAIKREPTREKEDVNEEEEPLKLRRIVINIRGLPKKLQEAKIRIQTKLKSLTSKTDIPLPPTMPRTLERQLISVAEKHNLTCRIEEQQLSQAVASASPQTPKRVLRIEGLEHLVHKAATEIQTEIIQFQSSRSGAGKVSVPPEWQVQTETVEVFKLQPSSQEWTVVSRKFSVTMPQANITKILRIQNQWLWEKYVQEKSRIHQKNTGGVNEMELFHGTRSNSPEEIYNSEEGFDMRYSSQGMWGMANYFAVTASYSDLYAYASTAGASLFSRAISQKEIFLANVLTGDSYECAPDKTLRMPPLRQGGSTSSEVQLKQVHYDSVNGYTRGSQVYMTYANNRAYPAYLISYTN